VRYHADYHPTSYSCCAGDLATGCGSRRANLVPCASIAAGKFALVGAVADDADACKNVSVAPEAQALLRYNQGGGASWNGSDGHPWMMYFFRWLPGRTAALFVKIHRPDICLPASGMTLVPRIASGSLM
jgi:hypothetical protein